MREKLKSILSHWGFIENLDVKAEDISYEPNRESHIWTINEDYLLKMTYTKEEMVQILLNENQEDAGPGKSCSIFGCN